MAHHRTEELRDALRGLLGRVIRNHTTAPSVPTPTTPSDVRPMLDTEPSTAFEALLRQQMQALEQQLQDLQRPHQRPVPADCGDGGAAGHPARGGDLIMNAITEARTIPARRAAPSPVIQLRPYQAEVARAVLDSVFNRRGLTFTVEMARQAGKNELSAYLQMVLLLRNAPRGGSIVKAAPTFQPQALISIQRIMRRLDENGLSSISHLEKGNILHVGRCRATYLSAHPTSNVVGQTADLLLEIDEAQDVSPDKFNRDFRPMAAAQNATTVLYGTAWRSDSLLEQVKASAPTAISERAYDPTAAKRHFRYDWQDVAQHNAPYGAFVEAERQRLGEEHPLFRTQYALLPLDETTRLFNGGQLAQLQGDHARQDTPRPGAVYVAGLDLAGAPVAISEPEWGASGAVARDETVLTIGEVVAAEHGGEPQIRVVQHYRWRGAPHGTLTEQLTDLLKNIWRVRRVAVDATGIGEPTAAALHRRMGQAVQPDYLHTTVEIPTRL